MYSLMIAEDEQLERQALRFIVGKHCPDIQIVGETGDGADAVQIASEQAPDIILMDVRMPEINGLEAAKNIRAILPDTMIIMLTAFDEFSYAKQALAFGAMDYLLKPLKPADLVRTLQATAAKVQEIRQKRQEEARLRHSLQEALPVIQMSFVYDLVFREIQDLPHLKERAAFLGLKADAGVVMAVDIDNFYQVSHRESELRKQLIKQNVFRQIVAVTGGSALVTPFGSDSVIVLLSSMMPASPDLGKEAVLPVAAQIRDAVSRNQGISITIGIGRWYQDLRHMHKSYLEAVHAQRQRFFLGDNQIIHVDDVPHPETGPFYYPFHYERVMMDKVRCGDRKQAKEALRQLLKELLASQAGMEAVKACMLELLIVLSRSAVEGGANLEQLTLLNVDRINQLTRCSSGEQMHYWMLDSLDRFLDNMLENRNSMNVRLVNRASEYIRQNCQRNVSLEEVAKLVHLSPFYFSRLFKQEKGCNFVDFLTRMRVDKAKRMLQNAEHTIVRIAAASGYQDASYFCRVFRQEVGMTPTQYRSQLLCQGSQETTKGDC
ncbi:response regulator [Acetonema longum]|uniref:Two component AraC family transcriptional regulator n=1 Tax=Acetonema longum DSM 6540 TaxID=1009370 RepID=F7NH29_9FIRM|nr:response regulator [Acetonema longum]EGO64760.1 two component AraC family transcriptional regulator [Acetonema longum DSM 6540]